MLDIDWWLEVQSAQNAEAAIDNEHHATTAANMITLVRLFIAQSSRSRWGQWIRLTIPIARSALSAY
jgi:hypothetical protein